MSHGANPTWSVRAGLAAWVVCFLLARPAPAGIGPDPEPLPSVVSAREARPIGPSHPADRASGPDLQPEASSASGWFFRTALALGGVLTLIAASAAVTRVLARTRGGLAGAFGPGGRAPSGVISVLGRYPVSRGQKLVLLHIDRRILVVSQCAGSRLGAGAGMSTLCEITDPEEVASILIKSRDAESDSMAERFRSMLGAVDRHFRTPEEPPDQDMRRLFAAPSGDRTELWDENAITPAEGAEFPVKQPGPPEHDAVGSLRRRLAALRSGDGAQEVPA
jgi:hypothetical protein